MTRANTRRFVVCVLNDGYPVSLEVRKIYEVVPDADAERYKQLRVIDESGEDYLFPEDYFRPIEISSDLEAAFRHSS
jgi:hypothetical protein